MKPPRKRSCENRSDVSNDTAFADIDCHFARFVERLSGGANPELALAAALLSRSRAEGNICLDLRTVAGGEFSQEAPPETIPPPEFERWMAKLRTASVVGHPEEFKPLVLDERGRLYLHRYWQYESNLARAIRQRADSVAGPVNEGLLREGLERFFPSPTSGNDRDWQRAAAGTAVRKNFCVISGGPGTGKTRTVAVVLALLLEQAGGRTLRIALAAPTGKAAARLQESIKSLKGTLLCEEAIKARLPEETFTLHRLLGGIPGEARFKYNAGNPLPFDVVVVDEASMVDLALMAKLFEAIPPQARVVFLGDKDQLASVEAGAVLGDICDGAEVCSSNPAPLAECIVRLRKNYRFGAENGILVLSQAINEGDAERALGLFRSQTGPVRLRPHQRENVRQPFRETAGIEGISTNALPLFAQLKEQLRGKVFKGFGEVVRAREPRVALQALNRYRILCAVRQGPFGVETINRLVEDILYEAGLISTRDRWYAGRPVMVTRNDYQLKLFNGDVGVIVPDAATGEARAWFLAADNSLRSIPPIRLPEHETVFTMTVHKSQGSEFEEVLFILPDRESPVLTRELLYTGVTRASRHVEMWFTETVFRNAVTRRVKRTSGLRDALWGQSMVMSSQEQGRSAAERYVNTID
jgi:exodeoxyribonuclease V alpha subunit